MITREEIDAVLAAHAAWKARFHDFLVGRSGVDIAVLGTTDHCAFGNWLDNYGAKYLEKQQYEEIDALHAAFHKIAADVAARLKARDFAGAHALIAQGGELEQASAALAARLLIVKDAL
ncbi:MAG: CZB domain-containing protein [Rhodocyclales bacterium]|nr:CZB domain-containing protein [Rhodocyclales bacterium]